MPRSQTILLARNAYTWQYGGAEQFTYNFAHELKQLGYRPVIITRVPELITKCKAEGIIVKKNIWLKNETRRRHAPYYYVMYPLLVAQYAWWGLRYGAELLLAGSRDDQMFGTLAFRLLKRPVLWVDHADMKGILSQPMTFLRNSYFKAMRHASKIIAVSQAEKQKITLYMPAEYQSKIEVINNGAPTPIGAPLQRPRTPVIGFVGRLEHDKGVFDLAQAIPQILKTNPDAVFWFAGKGEDGEQLQKDLKKYGENVHFFGHLDTVGSMLKSIDIFVYPSHHDASPLAPVEALLCGVPVVATNVGGIPEVVSKEAGILVDKEQPSQLASALNKLLQDPALLKKLKAGASKQGKELEFGKVIKTKYMPIIRKATNHD